MGRPHAQLPQRNRHSSPQRRSCRSTNPHASPRQALLHTYFSVADVAEIGVEGLKGLSYDDKTTGGDPKEESRDQVVVAGYTDSVYLNKDPAPKEVTRRCRGVGGFSAAAVLLASKQISFHTSWAGGPGLGLRTRRQHFVLRPSVPGRALCARCGPTFKGITALSRRL